MRGEHSVPPRSITVDGVVHVNPRPICRAASRIVTRLFRVTRVVNTPFKSTSVVNTQIPLSCDFNMIKSSHCEKQPPMCCTPTRRHHHSEADIHLQTGRLSRVVPLITVS